MADTARGSRYTIGDWIVDTDRCVITGGSGHSGETRVKPKAMAVLVALIRAEGRVVTRTELFDTIWPNSDVTDDVLTHCIAELRRAFGDSAKEPRYIETIPRRGVRLIPAVESSPQPAPTRIATGNSRNYLVGAIAAVVLIAGIVFFAGLNRPAAIVDANSVAVLPFVDMSENGDQEYFADGMTEELINELVKLEGLRVTGRTSSFYFKGRNEDLRDIGEQLNVATILEGSVRLSGDTLRITAQLIDVEDGFHLWSDTFDRRQADIFVIQEEIAENVAKALSIELGVGHLARYSGGTRNLDAHEAVLKGNLLYKGGSPEDAREAIASYKRAVELDPEYALGWERLASAYMFSRLILGAEYWAEAQTLAIDAIDRALELAPDSSIALQTAAYLQIVLGDFFSARAYFDQLQGADVKVPLYRSNIYIDMMLKTGHLDDALVLQQENILVDPKVEENFLYLGHTLASTGQIKQALALYETAYANGTLLGGMAYEALAAALNDGNTELIQLWLQRSLDNSSANYHDALVGLTERLGDRQASVDFLESLYADSADTDYIVSLFAGYLGADDLVLRTFERSADLWVFWYPMFADIRSSQQFVDIVDDIGLVRYWDEYGFNDFCARGEDGAVSCR